VSNRERRLSARLSTLQEIDDRVLAYVNRVPSGQYTENSPAQSAYSTLFGAHLLHALRSQPAEVRTMTCKVALEQGPDGFLEVSEPVSGGVHDATYLRLHKSALFFQLADLYNVDVCVPDVERLFPVVRLRRYLDELDWNNIWLHSNTLLGIASAADFSARRGASGSHRDVIVEFLLSRAPRHGFWGEEHGASRLNAMAGTFHLVPMLIQAERPIPSPDVLARAVLSLQTGSGFFCAPSGYSCIEYDAAYLLWALRPSVDAEIAAPIANSATCLFDAMVSLQNADGGFPEMGRPAGVGAALASSLSSWKTHRDFGTLEWHLKKIARLYLQPSRPFLNNSTVACASRPYESNIFSTWLRYLTCSLAADLAGIRRFDTERACRVVGLNYGRLPGRDAPR
jgi:hypothetical protein